MQKTVMTKAVAVALATLGAGAAFAQSTFTIYGNADVSLDNVHKTAGVQLIPGVPTSQGAKSTVTRVSPSATSQTSFGFKGTEDMGGGMAASFVLEGQLSHDTGALSQDGRMFGRQSYVGLTTPYGEVRLGRQYAPIFYSTALVTGERFGATDLFIEGGATNNLQVRQDNQISYWAKAGALTGAVAYSPNAGAYRKIDALRSTTGASAANGGILGAANAGTESATDKTGRAAGFFVNYQFDASLNTTFGFHRNEFNGAQFYIGTPSAGTLSASTLNKYQSFNLGAKYVIPGSNIMVDGAVGQGVYDYTPSAGDNANLRLQFLVVGTRIPVDQWTFSAQASQIKFSNFTKGKDTGLMLGSEYTLSKRTALFARFVQIRDDAGNAADAGLPAGSVVGGPDVIATNTGFRETPLFAGAGINPGGKSTYVGAGIRHSF
jgi:predicted porin